MYIDTREVVESLVPKYARGKTLDIGGGTSKYAETMRKNVPEYIVSDLYEYPGVDVITDARSLSFPKESFDTIVSFQLLEHVDDTAAVAGEMYRVLKKNGVAIVTAPFMAVQHGHPSDYHRFTLEGLKWYFEAAGFSIIEGGKQGSTLSVLSELVRFSFMNPYRDSGALRKKIVTRVCLMLKSLDRRNVLHNPDAYTNVYLVAKKS